MHFSGLPAPVYASRIESLLAQGGRYGVMGTTGASDWLRYQAQRTSFVRAQMARDRAQGLPLDARRKGESARDAENRIRMYRRAAAAANEDGRQQGDRAAAGQKVVPPVIELPPPHADSALKSFVLRFKTESEAQRFVRRWHNVPWDPLRFEGGYMCKARILY